MHKKRLLKLADLLEADAKNRKGIKFDLAVVARKEEGDSQRDFRPGEQPTIDCGTAACAIGLACLSGAFKRAELTWHIDEWGFEPMVAGKVGFEEAYRVFGLDEEYGDFLFLPDAYDKPMTGARGERGVAKRIRDFVAGKAKPPID